MNSLMIINILGHVLRIEGLLMLPSFLVGLIYHEKQAWAYLIMAVVCCLVGTLMSRKTPRDNFFYLKDGCVATAMCWIMLSIFGAIPFVLTGEIPRFVDAMFETVSGFTTTGSSILTDVEAMSYASRFWRSFSHWIGGMGVLVFVLAVVPLSGGSNFQLMRAESPGPSVGKLVPKAGATARLLYVIYLAMTLITIIALLISGMDLFSALTISFGTAGTGGFGVLNDSCASYTVTQQWIITVAMILFGVNFNFYYYFLFRKFRKALEMEEVRWYFFIIFAAIAVIFVSELDRFETAFETLTHTAFQVGTIITTTGFATTDFDLWSTASKTVLVFLMFLGACAGSTGGGFKVSRLMILAKSAVREINSYIHPKSIRQIKFDGGHLDNEMVRSVTVYLATYVLIFIGSVFVISFNGFDHVTTFSSVAATINNIGPGLSIVGPTGNFYGFSDVSKWVLIFDMLAGRLELFPLLILFHPGLWKEQFARRRIRKK